MTYSKIRDWVPHARLKATSSEIYYITNYAAQNGWYKKTFHIYFKNMEKELLKNVRNTINIMHVINIKKIATVWFVYMKKQWHMISLFRDFHDFMCGRDKKHYIRTDDCHRFINGLEKGLVESKFIKPVHRILCGENAPKKFIHPLFTQFN